MITLIELFSGAGTLTRALVDGFVSAGHEVHVAGCVELESDYLQLWSNAHGKASTVHGSVGAYHPKEISFPAEGFRICVAGVPCTGASVAGMAKNGLSAPEEHPDVGYLFLPTLHWIRAHKLDAVIFENVPQYANSVSAQAIRETLRASGFSLSERVVSSHTEFGAATDRRRWVMVASRHGRFDWIFEAKAFEGTIERLLDPEGPQDAEDSATEEQVAADSTYLARKQAEGCGFAMRVLDRTSTKVPTIAKSYGKRQPSATFVRTAQSYRMLRPAEVRRIHQFPDDFVLPSGATTSYEILGQGVVYGPFFALGADMGRWITSGCAAVPVKEHAGQMELFG